MIFGYSTNAFVKFSLAEAIEKIADLGFRGVEIMGDRPHLYPPDFDRQRLSQIKALLEKHRLKITNINSFTLFAVGDTYLPSWIEPDKDRRKIRIRHTLQSLEVAKFLGCENISVPPGGPVEKVTRAEAFKMFHEGLEKVIPSAENLGVKILVEPEPGLLMENSSEFETFIEDIQSPMVGLNFDIGHFFCAGENPRESFERLFRYVGHVHLEDIAADRSHNHLIAGMGAIDLEEVLTAMVRSGYQKDISLELYPYVDMPEKAGADSLDYLRPIFRRLGVEI